MELTHVTRDTIGLVTVSAKQLGSETYSCLDGHY